MFVTKAGRLIVSTCNMFCDNSDVKRAELQFSIPLLNNVNTGVFYDIIKKHMNTLDTILRHMFYCNIYKHC